MKIIAITQARAGSTRLPGKILKKIGQQTLLEIHIERILRSETISQLIVATTVQPDDKLISDMVSDIGIKVFRGSENDVLDRFYQAVKDENADYIVRLTSDCPLIDAKLIDKVVRFAIEKDLDYCTNTLLPKYPDGQDIEVFKFVALEAAWHKGRLKSEREHVTPYIRNNSTFCGGTLFKSFNFEEGFDYGDLRMTVDEPQDFIVIQSLINVLGTQQDWRDYAMYMKNHPEISNINARIIRNEGLLISIQND
jgi:spore coat polysaccharide biosynthesis protein SpsF